MKNRKWMIIVTCALTMCLMAACGKTTTTTPESEEKTVAEETTAKEETAEKTTKEEGTHYRLGDKMEDFTVTLSDGTELSLSGLLEEKKAVLINLWGSGCGPCRNEFPAIQEAYNEMSDEIQVLALSADPSDTDQVINDLKEELGLDSLPMGRDTEGLFSKFDTQNSIPVSIVVDRNGVVCLVHVGAVPSKAKFMSLFKVFTDAEYTEPVLLEEFPALAEAPAQPSAEELRGAFGITDENIQVNVPEDSNLWPFYPSRDGSYATAANGEYVDTIASAGVSVTLEEGQAFAYDYISYSESESLSDFMKVTTEDESYKIYVNAPDWKTAYVTFEQAGEHTVEFNFVRQMVPDDEVVDADARLANLRIIDKKELEELQAQEPKYPHALSGDAMEYEVIAGETKDIAFGNLENLYEEHRKMFEEGSRMIMQSDEMTILIKIGEDIDPTQALLSVDGKQYILSSMEQNDEGFLLVCKRSEPVHEILGLHFLAACKGMVGPADISVEWAGKEAEMDAYLQDLRQQVPGGEQMSWNYADGTAHTEPAAATEKEEAGESNYVITVSDEKGNPVKDVTLQICDESSCSVLVTDEKGSATFEGELNLYEVHVLKVPAGYADEKETFKMTKDLEITLKQK